MLLKLVKNSKTHAEITLLLHYYIYYSLCNTQIDLQL